MNPPTTKNITFLSFPSTVQRPSTKTKNPQNKKEKERKNAQTHSNFLRIPPFNPHPLPNLQWGFTQRERNRGCHGGKKWLQREAWGVHDRAGDGVREQQEDSGNADEVHKLRDSQEGLGSMWNTRGFLLQLSRCGGQSVQQRVRGHHGMCKR